MINNENKDRLLNLIKNQINKKEFLFFMYVSDFDYLDRIWYSEQEFKNLNYVLVLPSKMEWNSSPPKYKVLLIRKEIIENHNPHDLKELVR